MTQKSHHDAFLETLKRMQLGSWYDTRSLARQSRLSIRETSLQLARAKGVNVECKRVQRPYGAKLILWSKTSDTGGSNGQS